MENNNERKIYIFLLVVLCLISLGLGYYIVRNEKSDEIRPVPLHDSITLDVSPLISQDVIVTNSYVGFVEAINEVEIIPYISGYIQTVSARAGQFVQKNDLLITINPNEYKARVDAAEASVLQAKASFEYNQNYYERVQKSGKKAFSEIEIDNAKNNFLQAQANLKSSQANKMLAEVNYDYTIIKAPISGLVGNFTLSLGDYVAPNGQSLLSIVQTDPIRVVFSLTDKEYLDMKGSGELFKNSVIRLKLPNGTIYPYNGDFKYTNNQINKSTNSLAVYTYFKNDKHELLPNAFVTVEVSKDFKDSVIVDKNLVKMTTEGMFLHIIHDGNIQFQKIEILSEKDNKYVLKNTFQPTDLLILNDIGNIKPNTKFNYNVIK